jgi:hypothetical protein
VKGREAPKKKAVPRAKQQQKTARDKKKKEGASKRDSSNLDVAVHGSIAWAVGDEKAEVLIFNKRGVVSSGGHGHGC